VATIALLVIPIIPTHAVQPPLVTDTFYDGTIGQPRVVDPAVAYDTASGELISNVYETLIYFNEESVESFVGKLADSWSVSEDRLTWTFHIRGWDSGLKRSTIVKWHPWKDRNGVVHDNDWLNLSDVEYSFERTMVQDMSGSPAWMIYLPLTGGMSIWSFDADKDKVINATEAQTWIDAINNAVTCDYDAGTVTFHLNFPFPTVAFQQIWSQTWASIVHKEFAIEYGCWNGTYVGTQAKAYRRQPIKNYSPLDSPQTATLAPWLTPWPTNMPKPPVMCGTGPYKFRYWDKARLEWAADKFDAYWGGWDGQHVEHIIVRGVPEWSTRKMMFLAGEFDTVAVPRVNMLELLTDPTNKDSDPLPGITCIKDLKTLIEDNLFFIFNVTEESPYIGTGKLPSGIPTDFFSNLNTRLAFAYALDWDTLITEGWYGEAIQPHSWWVDGLKPDYENTTLRDAYEKEPYDYTIKYHKNLTKMEEYLKQAYYVVDSVNKSLWDSGFTLTLTYNLGNDQRKLANDLIIDSFRELNNKRSGLPPFTLTNVGLDWPVILDYIMGFEMPFTQIGWLADFADADNWARPYMHSEGDWATFQNLFADPHWNSTYVDKLIDDAIKLPEGAERNATYQELQGIYHDLVPSIPVVQALGRRWQRSWVQGWIYNILEPGDVYYRYYKQEETLQNVDLSAEGSITPITSYDEIHLFHYQMRLLGGAPAIFTFNLTVHRLDTTGPSIVYGAIGLLRNETGTFVYVGVRPPKPDHDANVIWKVFTRAGTTGADVIVIFDWFENGTMYMQVWDEAQKKLVQVPATGLWNISGAVYPISGNINDTNLANNKVFDGSVNVYKSPPGDIDASGEVDIFDAILLSTAFGSESGMPNWNPDADLVPEGVIDIFDAIVLSSNFGTSAYPA
jgi:peptide/nickel transport system substrate-binding protein